MKRILVPVDLLSELAESLACELDARYPASVRSYESQDRKYQAEMEPVLTARKIIAAPPAAQGEPVATIHVDGSFVHVAWRIPAPSRCAMDVYTAPQPAEQQPELAKYQPCGCVICTCEHETQCQGCGGHHCGTHPVGQFSNPVYQQPAEQQPSADDSLTPVPDELFAAEFNAWWEQHGQFCRAGGGDYERTFAFEAWRHLYPRLMSLQKLVAEQQPAPDVAGLVEALDLALAAHRKEGES